MSHILTLKVPDDVYSMLQSNAFARGVEVEDYCLRLLSDVPPNDAKVILKGAVRPEESPRCEGILRVAQLPSE